MSDVLYQESGHVHFGAGEDEDKDDGAVAQQRHEEDQPHAASQRPPVEQIFARHERT